MPKRSQFFPEVKERAVRLVREQTAATQRLDLMEWAR